MLRVLEKSVNNRKSEKIMRNHIEKFGKGEKNAKNFQFSCDSVVGE